MEIEHNIHLTSAEISSLWTNYIADSMSVCMFEYFRKKVSDTEVKPIVEHSLQMSKDHVAIITKIFEKEGIPIPNGFTEEDVNPSAPQLFDDTLILQYIKYMAKGGLATFGFILPNITRKDIREFYSSAISSTIELYNDSTSLNLSKGIDIRPPYIPYPSEVEFIKKQSFLAGWFGKQRPLTGQEIMNLYSNIQTNNLGEAIIMGFGQVAKSEKVRKYMLRGKEIATKHIDIFANYLRENDLPVPMTWNHNIRVETESPFSDKLMMYHISILNSSGMGNYGAAISMSQRKDLMADYVRLSAEVGKYAEDGLMMMIDHEWLEKPPQAVDREDIIKGK